MVRVRDLGHDGQPKAGTPGLAGPWRIQADEAVEYPTSVGHGYAPTIIGDDDLGPGSDRRTFKSNTTVPVADCIVDEVSH